jgi:broad specificity phosphatase PhoE
LNLLYLVRHGENRANLTREFSYRKVDYPLTARGIVQARQTASLFRRSRIDAIFSSPLRRATETAEIIATALGLTVVVVEEFREINVGVLEEQPPSDEAWAKHDLIGSQWRDGQHDVAFPGGEDYFTLLARMKDGLGEVLRGREGQHLIIVGHGGIFTATMEDLCPNARGNTAIYQPIPNCAITTLKMAVHDGVLEGQLVHWADMAHLSR